MKRGWGYGKRIASIEDQLSNSKRIINETELKNIYKSTAYYGAYEIILHDGRKGNIKSMVIIKDIRWNDKKCFEVTEQFTSFKNVFKYISELIKENFH